MGFARIGPKNPSGILIGFDQVNPLSLDWILSPHQVVGEGPTL